MVVVGSNEWMNAERNCTDFVKYERDGRLCCVRHHPPHTPHTHSQSHNHTQTQSHNHVLYHHPIPIDDPKKFSPRKLHFFLLLLPSLLFSLTFIFLPITDTPSSSVLPPTV